MLTVLDRYLLRSLLFNYFVTLGTMLSLYIVLDLFVSRHVDHPWEALPGFYGLYGFVGIVILVLLAKEMRKLVMRKEDYYDD